jgi:hypothetical protein
MKTISLLAATSLIAVFASPALAGQQIPFKGSLAAVETDVVQGGSLIVDGSAVGKATELGQFAMTYHVRVDLGTGGSVGTASFVAANGDSFSTTIIGQGTPTPDPTIAMIEEVETITGGTGRFASATGSFTLHRVVSLVTGVSTGSFNGAISNPGRR